MNRAAKIIEVVPSRIQVMDAITGKKADTGNFVRVREDEDGVVHTLINGSVNGVAEEHRVVGRRGLIVWQGNVSYSLPFFISND